MDRSGRNRAKEGLPARISAECTGIAEDIRDQNQSIRYDKIVAARARMSNGYYNSGHVVRVIAARLLHEGQPE